jgi:hypothetical protein
VESLLEALERKAADMARMMLTHIDANDATNSVLLDQFGRTGRSHAVPIFRELKR